MKILDQYRLPIQGLQSEEYEFVFDVENDFFQCFEHSLIQEGSFRVVLKLDKKYDHAEMDFEINGFFKTNCDRCLAGIKLPINSDHKMYLKRMESEEELNLEEDVLAYSKDDPYIDLSTHIYEMIVVSVPASKVYNCEIEVPRPCDMEVLNKLSDQEEPSNSRSIWDSLKNLDLNN